MSITTQTVAKVAQLARLDIPAAELGAYADQLSGILELMNRLNDVPTEGVEPMSHAVDMNIPMREDRVTNADQREALLACAPQHNAGHFRVPKVIE